MVDQYACVPLIGSIFLISFAIAALFSKGGLVGGATGSRDVFFLVIFVVIYCGRASASSADDSIISGGGESLKGDEKK